MLTRYAVVLSHPTAEKDSASRALRFETRRVVSPVAYCLVLLVGCFYDFELGGFLQV